MQAPYKLIALLGFILLLQACGGNKVYKSNCDADKTYTPVGFTQLIDGLPGYNGHYVQVAGKYKEGKGQSALFNDSLFTDHSLIKALWVDFSQDCPLYLEGTKTGFFDYSSPGELTPVNNKTIILRGRINLQYKGALGKYSGTIDHISYVKLQ
jgi:hypothetical protein